MGSNPTLTARSHASPRRRGGTAILALAGPHTAYLQLLPGLVLLGLGMAATMPSMTAAVMLAAPREFAGIASGVLNAARQVGGFSASRCSAR